MVIVILCQKTSSLKVPMSAAKTPQCRRQVSLQALLMLLVIMCEVCARLPSVTFLRSICIHPSCPHALKYDLQIGSCCMLITCTWLSLSMRCKRRAQAHWCLTNA